MGRQPVTPARAARAAAPVRSVHVVTGRVLFKGTNTLVSGVLAQLHVVAANGQKTSMGSAPVDRGSFEIRYPAESTARTADALQVTIRGPSGGAEAEPLGQSDLRAWPAAAEFFLIAIDADRAAVQGAAAGLAAAALSLDSAVASRAVKAGQDMAADLHEKIAAERRKAVDVERTGARAREAQLRNRVLQQITGVKQDSEAWRRMVAPGGDVDAVARAYQSDVLQGPIKNLLSQQGTRTYLVLSDGERAALGDPIDSVRIERLLRRSRNGAIERDEALAICAPDPADPGTPPTPTPGTGGTPPTSSSADEKVDELIRAIAAPDELLIEGPLGAGEVAKRVLGLTLAKGPADVPAFYDFHRLELAFDHIWEDARADGYVERAEALYRMAEELGGNPAAALESSEPPLRALQREAQIALRANARTIGTSVLSARATGPTAAMRPNTGAGPDLDPGLPPTWPPTDWPPPDWPPPTPPRPPRGDVAVDLEDLTVYPGPWPDPKDDNYPFTVFAANSVNFGLLVTYQQCFEPCNYQVGRLVGTRTLGPKETYSFTTRQVIKTTYNRKQIEANQQLRRDESETSYRDEAEIVNRAQTKTNFALTTQGGYDLGPLGEGSATTTLGRDAESSSQETKRAQRSAIQKAAQEARSEQRIELESAVSTEVETTEKREFTNINEELALNCVFYELQRRYRVSEKLHRVTPVALVAQKVPRPHEIDDDWVLRHDWILRRFLPDDSFQAALTYLATRAAGDKIILADLRSHMVKLQAAVDQLTLQIKAVRTTAEQQLAAIQNYVNRQSAIQAEEDSEGWLEGAWEAVAGQGEESRESIRILEEAARERYEKALRDEADLRTRLDSQATALQVATDAYIKALAEQTNRRVEVDRLIKHIRAYILHYMQGIWSYEHPDQRFFRHHTLTAPRLRPMTRTYALEPMSSWPVGVTPEPGKKCYRVTFTTEVNPDVESDDERATLAELVDLDRVLGFKGNYIIYPLKESNGLTDYMMMPYLDPLLGVRDPDDIGNWTLEEFTTYIECLRRKLTEAEFAEIEPALEEQRKKLLTSPMRNGEYVTIPSNSLYMQMMVDSGKALEGFKEAHRLMDVMKVKAEVRGAELDNLRRAKLVLSGQLDDPNIESVKNVYYRGPAPHDGDE